MEQLIKEYLFEVSATGILGLLAWGFRSWSTTIRDTSEKILNRLDYLTREFHQHKVDVERRVTRVETKVDLIHSENIEHRKEH